MEDSGHRAKAALIELGMIQWRGGGVEREERSKQ